MEKVTVFRYSAFDTKAGVEKVSTRMATKEWLELAKLKALEGTEREIDAGLINSNGQTKENFI